MEYIKEIELLKMSDNTEVQVFPWNNNFDTGIEIIDEQHKTLVYLINQLALSLVEEVPSLETDSLILELFKYAEYHFSTEENVWSDAFGGDSCVELHEASHHAFINKITEIKNRLDTEKTLKSQNEILHFLINWLAHHILESDMEMAKTLGAVKSGLSLDEAKKQAALEISESTRIFIDTLMMMYGDLSSRTLDLLRERNKRERIEQDLNKERQQEKLFSDHVIQSIPGLLYVYDENKKLIRWNSYHEDVLGYPPSELKEKFFSDLVSPSINLDEILDDTLSGEQIEFEQNVKYYDGREKTYLMTAVPFKLNGSVGFLGTGINISKLKAAERRLEQEAKETKVALKGILFSVSKAMEARDSYTAVHQRNVAEISSSIARKLELDDEQVEGIELGASIHDIGKVSIPAELLVKPTQLRSVEFELIKTHVMAGINILEDVKFPWPIINIISQHHERLDGTGYPKGLEGDSICLEARIVGVADVFEAMSSHRPYRPALGQDAALEELKLHKGIKYDERVVDALSELLKEKHNRFNLM
jgi:hemerythrin-like metal-binding protein/PAS domain S-box-containing protein/putative nucleotidyltransferase with HDIG domain